MISLVNITVTHDENKVLLIPPFLLAGENELRIIETAKNYLGTILPELEIRHAYLKIELHEYPCTCSNKEVTH